MREDGDRRRIWQARWQQRQASEFGWQLAEPAPQLVQLLKRVDVPPGRALDIACGSGVAARYLAGVFSCSVGFDVAFGAVQQGRATAEAEARRVSFLVADATVPLPFKDATFAFAFDRGGLSNLPPATRPAYLREVRRILQPGGVFQVLFSRPGTGERTVTRRLLRKLHAPDRADRPHAAGVEATLRQMRSPEFEIIEVGRFPFVTGGGRARTFTQVVFRRNADTGGG